MNNLKIHLCSDIHTEFKYYFIPDMEDEANTIVVLAGDIGVAKRPEMTYLPLIVNACRRFKHVFMVMGNHEPYHGKFPTTYAKIWNQTLDLENFDLLETEAVVIDDVAFIGATLCTDMDKNDPLTVYYAKAKMRDYKHIRTGPVAIPWRQKLAPLDTMTDHRMAKEYIFPVIEFHKKEGRKVVVITHQLPSFMSITDELKGDNLNGAYASELGNEICDAKPDLWCHGHTHHSFDYMIGNTRIVCNPRGYVPDEPNKGFIDDLIIEI